MKEIREQYSFSVPKDRGEEFSSTETHFDINKARLYFWQTLCSRCCQFEIVVLSLFLILGKNNSVKLSRTNGTLLRYNENRRHQSVLRNVQMLSVVIRGQGEKLSTCHIGV